MWSIGPLGFYSSADAANGAIARYQDYARQFNAGPPADDPYVYRRANVALNSVDPQPARMVVVERCVK